MTFFFSLLFFLFTNYLCQVVLTPFDVFDLLAEFVDGQFNLRPVLLLDLVDLEPVLGVLLLLQLLNQTRRVVLQVLVLLGQLPVYRVVHFQLLREIYQRLKC